MSARTPDPVLRRLIDGRARVAQGWCVDKLSIANGDGRSYCARGAVTTTGDWDGHDAVAREAEATLARRLPRPRFFHCGAWVADFNNKGTQAEVVALFDRAIAARRQEALSQAGASPLADRAEYLAGYLAGTESVPFDGYGNRDPHYARGIWAGIAAKWCGVDLSGGWL